MSVRHLLTSSRSCDLSCASGVLLDKTANAIYCSTDTRIRHERIHGCRVRFHHARTSLALALQQGFCICLPIDASCDGPLRKHQQNNVRQQLLGWGGMKQHEWGDFENVLIAYWDTQNICVLVVNHLTHITDKLKGIKAALLLDSLHSIVKVWTLMGDGLC